MFHRCSTDCKCVSRSAAASSSSSTSCSSTSSPSRLLLLPVQAQAAWRVLGDQLVYRPLALSRRAQSARGGCPLLGLAERPLCRFEPAHPPHVRPHLISAAHRAASASSSASTSATSGARPRRRGHSESCTDGHKRDSTDRISPPRRAATEKRSSKRSLRY